MKTPAPENISSKGKYSWYRIAALLALVGATLILALPIGLRLGLESWLNKQPGIVAQIEDIDLNLFSATLQLNDIVVQQYSQPVLSAKTLQLQLDWLPLLHQRIALDHINFEDGQLQLSMDGPTSITIGGFTLNLATQAPDTVLPSVQHPPQVHNQWGIASGNINIKNFLLRYHQLELDLNLTINNLSATPVMSWQPQLSGSLGCDLAVNGAQVQLDAQLQPFAAQPSATGTLSVNSFDIRSIAPLLSTFGWSDTSGDLSTKLHLILSAEKAATSMQLAINGRVTGNGIRGANADIWLRNLNFNWQGDSTINIFPAAPTASLNGKLTITNSDLELQQPGYRWHQQLLSWEGKTNLTAKTNSQNTRIDIQGDLQLEQSTIIELEQQRQLAHIDQATVTGLHFNASSQLRCAMIHLQKVQALQRTGYNRAQAGSNSYAPDSPPQHIVDVATVELNDLSYAEQQLHGNRLHLAGFNLDLVRNSSGAMEIQQWLINNSTTNSAANPTNENQEPATPLIVNLAQVVVDKHSSLSFRDNSLATPTNLHLSNIQLSLSQLNSAKPEQPSSIALSAMLDKYSSMNISGQIQPFTTPANFSVNGAIKEFHLPSISAYTEDSIGYTLNQGQLTLDFTAPCSQGQLNIDSNIFLSQLRMQPLSAADDSAATASLGMPVNLALALLRDRDGNINLHLPIHGNLNDPNLKIAPALRLALTNTIKNTIMLTLAPLGIVAKAGQLVGIGAALNFDRLTFEPGTTQLSSASQQYLPKVAQLLVRHPQLISTISGRVTTSDIEYLQQLTSANSKGTPSPPVAPGSLVIPAAQLAQLAGQRANIIRQALLEQQVANAQLLVTKSQSNISAGTPGVDLTIQ